MDQKADQRPKWPESARYESLSSFKACNIPAIIELLYLHRLQFVGRLRQWFCRCLATRIHSWCPSLWRWNFPRYWWCRKYACARHQALGYTDLDRVDPWTVCRIKRGIYGTILLNSFLSCYMRLFLYYSLHQTSLKPERPVYMARQTEPFQSCLSRLEYHLKSDSEACSLHYYDFICSKIYWQHSLLFLAKFSNQASLLRYVRVLSLNPTYRFELDLVAQQRLVS